VKASENLELPLLPDIKLFEFDPEIRWCEDHGLTVIDDVTTFGTVRSDALGIGVGTAFGVLGFSFQYKDDEALTSHSVPAPIGSATASGEFDACFDILSLLNFVGFSVGGKVAVALERVSKFAASKLAAKSARFATVDEAITDAIVAFVNNSDKLEKAALAGVKHALNSKVFRVVPTALRTQIRDWAGILATGATTYVLNVAKQYIESVFRNAY
jgi:hypothetical protein